jgi:hypothetical protein
MTSEDTRLITTAMVDDMLRNQNIVIRDARQLKRVAKACMEERWGAGRCTEYIKELELMNISMQGFKQAKRFAGIDQDILNWWEQDEDEDDDTPRHRVFGIERAFVYRGLIYMSLVPRARGVDVVASGLVLSQEDGEIRFWRFNGSMMRVFDSTDWSYWFVSDDHRKIALIDYSHDYSSTDFHESLDDFVESTLIPQNRVFPFAQSFTDTMMRLRYFKITFRPDNLEPLPEVRVPGLRFADEYNDDIAILRAAFDSWWEIVIDRQVMSSGIRSLPFIGPVMESTGMMMMAAQPKRPRMDAEQKLVILKKRMRGEAPAVEADEVEQAAQSLRATGFMCRQIARGELTMTQIIAKHSVATLEELAQSIENPGSGQARRSQIQEICKTLVPELTRLEEIIQTTKALYAELMGETQEALANEFHVIKADAADFSLKTLRKALEGACTLKTKIELNTTTNAQLQEQIRVLQQNFQAQVEEQARVLAYQMMSQSSSSQAVVSHDVPM